MSNVQSNIAMTDYPKILCYLSNCFIFSQLHPLQGLKITWAIALLMPTLPGNTPMWRCITNFPHSLVHFFWAAVYSSGSQGSVILKKLLFMEHWASVPPLTFPHTDSLCSPHSLLVLSAFNNLSSCSLLESLSLVISIFFPSLLVKLASILVFFPAMLSSLPDCSIPVFSTENILSVP